ncbi:MAG: hypothetical protein AAFY48_18255 [Bacteroidota bacterium]
MFTSRHLFLISALGFLAHFFSCTSESTTVEEPEYLTGNFYVRYLVETNELKGQASFFSADSTALQLPNGVAFMGSGTQERQLPGDIIRYETTLPVAYTGDLRFNFQLPKSEEELEVKHGLGGITGFEVETASKTEGLVIDMEATLGEGENLLLLFTDPNQEARTILRPGPLSREKLFIPADAVALFEPGEYRLYLVKQIEVESEVANLRYRFSAEYYTPEEAFILEE